MYGTPGDKWAQGKVIYTGRSVNLEDIGIAHRTLPIGSLVVLQNPLKPSKWVVAQVMDRGPYGALLGPGAIPQDGQTCRLRKDKRTWCVKKKRTDPGVWRGCMDLMPNTAKLLEHNTFQKVRYWRVPKYRVPKKKWPSRL